MITRRPTARAKSPKEKSAGETVPIRVVTAIGKKTAVALVVLGLLLVVSVPLQKSRQFDAMTAWAGEPRNSILLAVAAATLAACLHSAYEQASQPEKDAFRELLALSDPVLIGYLLGKEEHPDRDLADTIEKIRSPSPP